MIQLAPFAGVSRSLRAWGGVTHVACGAELSLSIFDLRAELLQQRFLHPPYGRRLAARLQGELCTNARHKQVSAKHLKDSSGLIVLTRRHTNTLRVRMSSTRTTNSSRSLKMPSPPLSLSSSSLSPAMAASPCFWARCRELTLGAGRSSGEAGDSGDGAGDSF